MTYWLIYWFAFIRLYYRTHLLTYLLDCLCTKLLAIDWFTSLVICLFSYFYMKLFTYWLNYIITYLPLYSCKPITYWLFFGIFTYIANWLIYLSPLLLISIFPSFLIYLLRYLLPYILIHLFTSNANRCSSQQLLYTYSFVTIIECSGRNVFRKWQNQSRSNSWISPEYRQLVKRLA